jgi:hypothetical protein
MAADTFLTHSMIAERALFDLQNSLTMAQNVYRGYNSEFQSSIAGYKKGNSVTVHLPNKFRTKAGPTMDSVGVQENSTTVSVDVHRHVALDFLETDLTLSIEDFARKYTNPATIALGNYVDLLGCQEYVNIYNEVGTPGTTPSTFGVLADAALRMDNEAVPRDARVSVLSPKAHWTMADGELKGVFQQNIVDTLLRRGFIGNFALMNFFMDPNIQSHTTGLWNAGSTGVMNGATAEGASSIVTDGWAATTAILKEGDIFTIANVVGVNPISGSGWEGDELRQFVATADVASVVNDATIPIAPQIYSSAATEDTLAYQTIVTLPVNGAALVVRGADSTAYPKNLAYHPDCFALTMVPLRRPKSAGQSVMWAQASDQQLGLSITISTGFDISAYDESTRLDILLGWDTIRPELGCRITG